ncbi:MAG: hypothetical protein VKL39_16915 [Leptolyngbyaceae bacterium]|nr:hypothetical protein [Leptolyngbyaceae bacterium]
MTGRTVPQSDLYAVGRTIVFLLTGIHPLDLDAPNAAYVLGYLNQGLVEPPVRLSTLQVPLWPKLLNLRLFSVLLVTTLLWVQGHRENQQIDSQDDIIQLN